MNFREARIDDLITLNHISIASKRHWGYPEDWIENWRDDLSVSQRDLKSQEVLLMELETKIIGFCSIKDQIDHYELIHLWVLPEFIGKGYGKMLLKKALTSFILEDKPIRVLADPNAESFYEKQGFMTFDKIESYPKGRFLPMMKMNSFYHMD